ncbi:phosphoribosylformylglycinamidine cyclo-ligase [Alphaproteobacteria bacterium]|nr:phosphoribosylformylglycinamidine cyclo-ligase [Alphaproteobacteria bacterium]
MSSGQKQPKSLKYSDAGVDIDEGDALIGDIAPHAKRTKRAGASTDLGGFGGLFDTKAAGFHDPILVAATDGVGTKLELAKTTGLHRGVGIDLVAMCANDILAQGAMPLFFLDYFATGKLERDMAVEVIAGIADGCVEADCALIGGETAEMPGMYPAGTYDLAGFCIGAAERGTLLSPGQPKSGDVAIGLRSSGVHSNGFSLVRKIIEISGAALDAPAPFAPDQGSLGAQLMAPTRIYQKTAATALATGGVNGIVHVTGGGLIENPPRVYDDTLAFTLDCAAAPLPPVFGWLRDQGRMELFELARTFNCGIGLIIYVEAEKADAVLQALKNGPEPDALIIGKLGNRYGGDAVILENSDHWLGQA